MLDSQIVVNPVAGARCTCGFDETWQLASVKDWSARERYPTKSSARMSDGRGCRKRSPRPREGTPNGGAQVLALSTTPGQLAYFVALALQQHGQQSGLRKCRSRLSHNVLFLFVSSEDDVIYIVGGYGLGVFSERLTVSCLANARLGTGANDEHPNWVEPNGNWPT
jgi:hypothetical protein